MKIANDVTQLVGNTPLVKINKLSNQSGATILAKCEFMNPTGSIKDRIAKSMIEQGLKDRQISPNTTIIEPTSGNTGIGLAMVCASKNLPLILTMPDSMSIERVKLFKAFGAKVELTPAKDGMEGAIKKAIELHEQIENSFLPQQFKNKANPQAHIDHTALEILDATEGKIDIFVSAVGTGGTLMGNATVLKQHNPNIKIVAVEPSSSAVLSGDKAALHDIQGIGAGFVPEILDTNIYDQIIKVDDQTAYQYARELALKEGLLVGISSGANIYAASLLAGQKENQGKTIVTILCDTGERYLSTSLYGDM